MTAYRALRTPRHEIQRIRGLDIHLTRWGPAPSELRPPVFLLHGWQDTGDTFQFMVDALAQEWSLVAPDWRGFGRSQWPQDGYWFPDYLADLDAMLNRIAPGVPVPLVGHSMGGNIASLYAGLRPERVRCVASLEGFGLSRSSPETAPAQMRKWLDQLKAPPLLKTYESFEQLASVIGFRYPRFPPGRADFVARAWGRLEADGRVHLLGDARHRWVNPIRYARDDAEAIWRAVEAPVLMILGSESDYLARLGADGTDDALRRPFARIELARVAGAGHMLHIEKAERVASLVEHFLVAHDVPSADGLALKSRPA